MNWPCVNAQQAHHASPDIQARLATLDEQASEFEVWSVATAEGTEQLMNALRKLSSTP